MTESLLKISAISLFVEDLSAAKAFYAAVFKAAMVYEDANSAVFQFDNLIINLLYAGKAHDIVEPGAVASRDSGSRFQLSVWVADVDAVCAALKARGVTALNGPINRPWGMRTANFVDPAGHSWEVAQQLPATP